MNDGHGETADFLLNAAAGQGRPVSRAQLKRWHAAGLLPRPARRPLGKGHGTATVYPAGTSAQLRRILEMRGEGGRFDPERALWRLWWEGWAVASGAIRERLDGVLSGWERALTTADDPDTLAVLSAGRPPPTLARARKRVGARNFDTALYLVLEMAAGQARGKWQDGDDAGILLSALGLNGAVRRLAPNGERFAADLAGTRQRYSLATSPESLRVTLDAATGADLTDARDDIRAFVEAARVLWPVVRPFLPASNTGRDLLAQSARDVFDLLPSATLLALALRRHPTYRQLFDALRHMHGIAEGLREARANEDRANDKKPPRRRQPSGGAAQGDEPPCATSLAPPPE